MPHSNRSPRRPDPSRLPGSWRTSAFAAPVSISGPRPDSPRPPPPRRPRFVRGSCGSCSARLRRADRRTSDSWHGRGCGERHEGQEMSATGEGLGAGWEQERTHRTGEQKAAGPPWRSTTRFTKESTSGARWNSSIATSARERPARNRHLRERGGARWRSRRIARSDPTPAGNARDVGSAGRGRDDHVASAFVAGRGRDLRSRRSPAASCRHSSTPRPARCLTLLTRTRLRDGREDSYCLAMIDIRII